jgi:hypothetical protein
MRKDQILKKHVSYYQVKNPFSKGTQVKKQTGQTGTGSQESRRIAEGNLQFPMYSPEFIRE